MLNLSDSEKAALLAIDESKLTDLIEQAVQNESSVALHRLPLSSCGPYVSVKLHRFDECLGRLREAKSSKNREQKIDDVRRAASDLSFAFTSMKRRMVEEEQDGELFFVDDHILWPHQFSENLSVRISYRWRRSVEDPWTHGSITFHYKYKPRLDLTQLAPTKKLSAAKQAQNLQNELSQAWEHLMRSALYSVRDFFKDGGDGSTIPSSFQARVDAFSGGLNNYSTVFWKNAPKQVS